MNENEKLKQDLAQCQQRFEILNQEFEEFAYIVSHDLIAPLRGIMNLAQWIEEDTEGSLDPEVQEHLRLLKSRSLRMKRMIDGLVEYSRVKRRDLEFGKVDLNEEVNAIIETLAVPEGIEIKVENSLPELVTYRSKIVRVLGALLGNAVTHFEGENGRIQISSKKVGEFYEISVEDNGAGISEEFMSKISAPFYSIKAKKDSMGMGLTISSKIVNFVGGEMKMESTVGKGSKFSFTWPVSLET